MLSSIINIGLTAMLSKRLETMTTKKVVTRKDFEEFSNR